MVHEIRTPEWRGGGGAPGEPRRPTLRPREPARENRPGWRAPSAGHRRVPGAREHLRPSGDRERRDHALPVRRPRVQGRQDQRAVHSREATRRCFRDRGGRGGHDRAPRNAETPSGGQEQFRPHHPGPDPGHVHVDHGNLLPRDDRARIGRPPRGRHRRHGDHDGVGHGTHARNRGPQGGGRLARRHPHPVPHRGRDTHGHRRPPRRDRRHRRRQSRVRPDEHPGSTPDRPHAHRRGNERRDRPDFRSPPGEKGGATRSDRSAAIRVANCRWDNFTAEDAEHAENDTQINLGELKRARRTQFPQKNYPARARGAPGVSACGLRVFCVVCGEVVVTADTARSDPASACRPPDGGPCPRPSRRCRTPADRRAPCGRTRCTPARPSPGGSRRAGPS